VPCFLVYEHSRFQNKGPSIDHKKYEMASFSKTAQNAFVHISLTYAYSLPKGISISSTLRKIPELALGSELPESDFVGSGFTSHTDFVIRRSTCLAHGWQHHIGEKIGIAEQQLLEESIL
jgi:hypothetical protein